MLEFRLLRADEIDARIAQCGAWGVQLLLYKDARADMALMDECVGPENWQRKHEVINGSLFCSVGIRVSREDGSSEWIWRQDVGTESNTEKEKGQASDSFKRACTCFGAGRELYTSPAIFVNAKDLKTLEERNGRWSCRDTFEVVDISYDGRRISAVQIRNTKTGKLLNFGNDTTFQKSKDVPKQEPIFDKKFMDLHGKDPITQREIEKLIAATENRSDGKTLEAALRACRKSNVQEINYAQYLALCTNLGIAA